MAIEKSTTEAGKGFPLSVDTWAVIVALVLALTVKFNLFKNVPW